MADHTLTLNLVLPPLEFEGSLDYQGPRSTDTSNAFDGAECGGTGIVERTPPVATGSYPVPTTVDKALAFPMPDLNGKGWPVTDDPSATSFLNPLVVSQASHVERVIVGGKDITWFRATSPGDAPTVMPGYTLIEPYGYGASQTLVIPRTNSLFEKYGHGELGWLDEGASVQYQRVYSIGDEDQHITVDYRGVVLAVLTDEVEFRVNISGEVVGRTTTKFKPPVKRRGVFDIGTLVSYACSVNGVNLVPAGGPTTGLKAPNEGGLTWDSWLTKLGAMTQTADDPQRVLMPFGTWGGSRYSFSPKNITDKHATIHIDGARAAAFLADDVTEQITTVYGNGISPEGERWDGAKYPGIAQGPPEPYPFADNRDFGIGTTNADTDSGFGITVLRHKIAWDGLLAGGIEEDLLAPYDARLAHAVESLQEAAGLTVDGVMTTQAWAALWNTDVVGYSLNGAKIYPLAQASRVRPFNISASGDVIGRNPNYVHGSIDVSVSYDYGVCDEDTARNHARSVIRLSSGHQWAGRIVLNGVHAFAGEVADEDIASLTAADMMLARDIRPGMNVWLPHFEGGTLLHVAQATVTPGEGGDTVELMVDTGYRDIFDLSQALARNRESRRSPYREWIAANQGHKPPGNLITRDRFFGRLYQDVRVTANRWNVFPVVLGQQGTVGRTDILLDDLKTEYCVAVFARKITPTRLARLIGNPFHVGDNGQTAWESESNQHFEEQRVLLYLAGQGAQPVGYGWKIGYKSDGTRSANPLTGRHIDDASWPYVTAPATAPLAYVALFPRKAATVHRGRLFYALEDDVT